MALARLSNAMDRGSSDFSFGRGEAFGWRSVAVEPDGAEVFDNEKDSPTPACIDFVGEGVADGSTNDCDVAGGNFGLKRSSALGFEDQLG